jgi:hypothetical protein
MTEANQLEQLLSVVAGLCGGSPPISGRVVDQVGLPVEGAVVRTSRTPSPARTDASRWSPRPTCRRRTSWW